MKSTKFHCLVSVSKYVFQILDMTDHLLDVKVNSKETVILKTTSKLFAFVKTISFIFLSSYNSFFGKHNGLIFSLIRKRTLSRRLNLKKSKNLEKDKSRIHASSVISQQMTELLPARGREKKQNRLLLSNDFNVYSLRVLKSL